VKQDDELRDELSLLIQTYPAIGFWQSHYRLRRKGFSWNHKRVYRVYAAMGLNIRRRLKKRLPARVKQALFQPEKINQVWSIDFMNDSLWNGSSYRLLNVMDDYNREILWIESDTSLPALRVIRVLECLKESRGLPEMIRVDNGPEFISAKLDMWCKENKVILVFIQPGKPTQNAFIERCMETSERNYLMLMSLKRLERYVSDWKNGEQIIINTDLIRP
jgi:putative transposase